MDILTSFMLMIILLILGILSIFKHSYAYNHTKCVSLSNQKSKIQTSLINLHSNEYSQDFHYYSCAIKLDICV